MTTLARRDFLRGALAGLTGTGAPSAAAAAGSGALAAADAAAARLWQRIAADTLQRSPELAAYLGEDHGPLQGLRSRLDRRDAGARLRILQPIADAAPALRRFAQAPLSPTAALHLDALLWTAECGEALGRFDYGGVDGFDFPTPYPVSRMTGSHLAVPDLLLNRHPLETSAHVEAYLSRLDAWATALDDETARVRAEAGAAPMPANLLLGVGAQVRAAGGDEAAALWLARLAPWPNATAKARRTLETRLRPALGRQAEALDALTAHGGGAPGAVRLQNGALYYAACLRLQAGLPITAAEAHAMGRAEVKRLAAELDRRLAAAGRSTGTLSERLLALAQEPGQLYADSATGRAELLADARALVARMGARLPAMFPRVPAAPLEIQPIPQPTPGARAYSQNPSADGRRPGVVFMNLHDIGQWTRWNLPTVLFHEGVPGHHLQAAWMLEAPELPKLRRFFSANAYAEGWALHAESLAAEAGLYEGNPLGEIGWLQAQLYRACRLVADTGLHALGWDRDESVTFLMAEAGLTRWIAESETDRYCAFPAQACGYSAGALTLASLRVEASAHGLSLPAFHARVLDAGPSPLTTLQRAVRATWESRPGRPASGSGAAEHRETRSHRREPAFQGKAAAASGAMQLNVGNEAGRLPRL